MTDRGTLVNDVHAQLNATVVRRVLRPASVDDVREAVLKARAAGRVIAIAGGRHAMGGQQFGAELDLLDMTGLDGSSTSTGSGARSKSRRASCGRR